VPVVLISTLINLPKFFESTVKTSVIYPKLPSDWSLDFTNGLMFNGSLVNRTHHTDEEWFNMTGGFDFDDISYEHRIAVTALRKNPDYTIYYNNWTRLFVIGIVPTILLIYFNYKVLLYCSITVQWRESNKHCFHATSENYVLALQTRAQKYHYCPQYDSRRQ
jgi:hypothetical protein